MISLLVPVSSNRLGCIIGFIAQHPERPVAAIETMNNSLINCFEIIVASCQKDNLTISLTCWNAKAIF